MRKRSSGRSSRTTRSLRRPTPCTRPRDRWTTRRERSRSASARPASSPNAPYDPSAMPDSHDTSDTFRAVAVVTAAGSAERFGGKKLLAQVDGEPLLDRTIRSLLEGGVGEVIVVVGADARAELERDVNALNDPRVRPVENP